MQNSAGGEHSRLKIILAVLGVLLVAAALAIKFLAIDEISNSASTISEMRRGAGELGVLPDGSGKEDIRIADDMVVRVVSGTRPSVPQPMPRLPMPDHPFMMDETASAGVHGDTYNSSVTPFAGPLGIAPAALYVATRPGNEINMCTPMNITPTGKLVSVCVGIGTPSQLVLFDPEQDFKVIAQTATSDASKLGEAEPGLGWYTGLDNQGRAIVVNPQQQVRLYSIRENEPRPQWHIVKQYDLSSVLAEKEPVMDIKPDWHNNLWFNSRQGQVGFIDAANGQVKRIKLPDGEVSGTAIAISPDAVFILTTAAVYRFEIDQPGNPVIRWRYVYGKSSLNGDLTAPTLLDGGKLIAFGISDDQPFARVLVVQTDGAALPDNSRVVCEHPVFEANRGFLANSFIGYSRSLVIQNNHGAGFFDPTAPEPGLARVDVRPDYSGCDTVWQDYSISSKVPPKLSTRDGYVYEYAIRLNKGVYSFYLTATDFRTGRKVQEVFLGSGNRLDSPMLSINFMPGNIMVAGAKNGLLVMKDGPFGPSAAKPAAVPKK